MTLSALEHKEATQISVPQLQKDNLLAVRGSKRVVAYAFWQSAVTEYHNQSSG